MLSANFTTGVKNLLPWYYLSFTFLIYYGFGGLPVLQLFSEIGDNFV
jgi:hypothetical protein